jgi:hypothetical protein
VHRPAGFVVQSDALLPAGEHVTEAGVALWLGRVRRREQPQGAAGPGLVDVVLLGSDGLHGAGGQRDELLGSHLVAVEAQARPAGTVGHDGIEDQGASVTGAQPRLGDDDDEMAVTREEPGQVGFGLQLGHDGLGYETGQGLVPAGQLVVVEDCVGVDCVGPAVASVLFQESPQEHSRHRLGGLGQRQRDEPRQIALNDGPVDVTGAGHGRLATVEERGEPFKGEHAGDDGAIRTVDRQAVPSPTFGCLAEPRLGYPGEVHRLLAAVRRHPQVAGSPLVGGIDLLEVAAVDAAELPGGVTGHGGVSAGHAPLRRSSARRSAASRCT